MAANPVGSTRNFAFARSALFGALLSLPFFSGCSLQMKWVPALNQTSSDVTALSSFSATWAFDALDSANYSFDSTKIDFTGGVCRLSGTDQVDDDNTASGFGGGALSGAVHDGTNGYLRLSQTGTPTNTAELDASWTPKWGNLIWYWKMNGSGAFPVSANPDFGPGTIDRDDLNTSYGSGRMNGDIETNGTLDLTGSSINTIGDKISVGGWVKIVGTANAWGVIFRTNGGADWMIQNDGNQNLYVRIDTNLGADQDCGSGGANTVGGVDGNWHYFVFTLSSGVADVYLDGALKQHCTYNHGTGFASTNAPWLNAVTSTSTPSTYLDDWAVWHDQLSAADIATIYSRQSAKYSGQIASRVMDAAAAGQTWTTLAWKPTLPFFKELPDYSGGAIQNESSSNYSSLVGSSGTTGDDDLMSGIAGAWHLNESSAAGGASNDFKDTSGNAHYGEATGTVAFATPSPFGKGVSLDGTGGYVNFGNNHGFSGVTPFSVSVWFKTSLDDTALVGKPATDGSGNQGWLTALQGGWVCIERRVNSGQKFGCSTTSGADGKWHHFVGTYDGAVLRAYLDGVLGPITDADTRALAATTGNLRLGSFSGPLDMQGSFDELAIWPRALDPKEVQQLYRRGANRLKFQVRTCTASDCSDDSAGANWKGPDGTNQTYFSELNNNSVPLDGSGTVKAGLPSMLFSDFTSPVGTSRYFQYRAILESDDSGTGCDYGSGATWCSPELKSVTVDPVHYDSGAPTVAGKLGAAYASLDMVTESLGASCADGLTYNIGVGASEAAATWYWWDAARDSDCVSAGPGAWCPADGTATKSNSEAVLNAHLASFKSEVGAGTAYFKAFLHSSGTNACEIDQLGLSGLR